MWGGREHPAYQDISEATSVLLGRGRLVYQKVMLKKGAPDEQPFGLAGNCVLLTQPKSSEIIQTLPPPPANLTDGFVVLFTTRRQDVRKAKMLEVPREQYVRCARLRAEVCEVFADYYRARGGGARYVARTGHTGGLRRRSIGSKISSAFQTDYGWSSFYA